MSPTFGTQKKCHSEKRNALTRKRDKRNENVKGRERERQAAWQQRKIDDRPSQRPTALTALKRNAGWVCPERWKASAREKS